MKFIRYFALVAVIAASISLPLTGNGTASAGPTCSEELGIDHHGIHITHDYVQGSDGGPGPGDPAEVPGGPGPGFHFLFGLGPGASFCVDQSQAPGIHF